MHKLQFFTKISLCLLLGFLINSTAFAAAQEKPIEDKLLEMNLKLPTVSAPVANYVPYVIVGNLVFISGQLPMEEGKVKFTGKLGDKISEEQGIEGAKIAALNIIAHLKSAVGSLDRVKRCVKITGFVNSTPDFTTHPKIINGASDLIVNVFGDKGKHARAAVGVSSLPLGAAVEVEAIFEIE
jgi:enamine deaminase RidA (YjgF/YER057c/UK114 family)